ELCELLAFKRRKEKTVGPMTNAQLATAFREGVQQSDDAETISDTYVQMANLVDKRIMNLPDVVALVFELDAKFGQTNPINALTKIYNIALKAKDDEKVFWAVATIHDAWMSGAMHGETLSLRYIQGTGPQSGGKGFIDLTNQKLELKNYIISEFIDSYTQWGPQIRQKMRSVLTSHKAYRQACGFTDGDGDITFRGTWPGSAENAFQLCE
ncbi:unnamed protein product, partial [Prorocentrum cordatum]